MNSLTIKKSFVWRLGLFLLFLLLTWALVWYFHEMLETSSFIRPLLQDPNIDTVFWIVMKLLVWILPISLLLWKEKTSIFNFLVLKEKWKLGLLWGVGSSVLWIGVCFFLDQLSQKSFHAPLWNLGLLNGVLISPILEEILFRGFILIRVEQHLKPFHANFFTSVIFVLIHIIGWAFQKELNFPTSLAAMAFLFIFSLILGCIRQRSGSLLASILLHIANNGFAMRIWLS